MKQAHGWVALSSSWLMLSAIGYSQTLELQPIEVQATYEWVKKSATQPSPAYTIEKKQLQDSGLTDVTRELKTQNGVNVQETAGITGCVG